MRYREGIIGYNSQDRLREYRKPSEKSTSYAETGVQSNFETYRIVPLNALKAKYHRGENLTTKEEKEFIGLIQSDQRSDGLLDKFRKDPNSLNSNERKEFLSYVDRYYIETITGKTASGYKLASSTSPVNAKNRFESEYLINDPVPKRDYGHFPFAGTNTQKSQAVDSLPEESKNWLGWRSEKHSRDEDMYYAINGKYEAIENYKESFNGKLAYSVKDGLELGTMIYSGGVLSNALSKLPATVNALNLPNKVVSATAKVGDLAKAHPILTEKLTNSGLSMTATHLGNSYQGKDTSASDLAWSGTTGFITGGTNFKTTLIVNTVSSGLQGYFESNEDSIKHAGYKAVSSAIATSLGGAVGKSMEKTADMAILKGLSKNRSYYNPEYRNRNFYYTGYEDYKKYPVRLGVAADSFTGESLNKFLEGNEQDIRNFSRESLYAK